MPPAYAAHGTTCTAAFIAGSCHSSSRAAYGISPFTST